MKRLAPLGLLSALAASALLSSCPSSRDFERAVHVGDAYLPDTPIIRSKPTAASGGRLIFALPNGFCEPITFGFIRFDIKSGNERFAGDLYVSDLTWSHAHGSCDAIGYVDYENSEELSNNAGVDNLIRAQHEAISSITLNMTGISVSGRRKIMVWLIYGDRIPSREIWGTEGGGGGYVIRKPRRGETSHAIKRARSVELVPPVGLRDQSVTICASRSKASAYFASVRPITSIGSRGPGGVLSQSSVSR